MIDWPTVVFLVLAAALILMHRRAIITRREALTQAARFQRALEEAESTLAIQNARTRQLSEVSTDALILVGREKQVYFTNAVAERFFGPLQPNRTFVEWTRQHLLADLVDQAFTGAVPPPQQFNLNDTSLEARAAPVVVAGQVDSVALVIQDISELQRLGRARRDFVANISHELRTPLASIQLVAETLLNNGLDDPGLVASMVSKIMLETETLHQLAQELLDLSMIESGQVLLKMSPVNLHDLAAFQVERLSPQAERKNLQISLEIPEDLTGLADEALIGRVMTNLLHNAIKFTDHGWIRLAGHKENDSLPLPPNHPSGRWIVVSVADSGIGIPAADLPRIFERFYKIDRARTRQRSGTGLGLAIARHIVEGHGGRIWADSVEGSGTTFFFSLPAVE